MVPMPQETPYVRPDGYAERYRDQRFTSGHGRGTHRREQKALEALLRRAGGEGMLTAGTWLDVPSGVGRFSATLPGPALQVDRSVEMVRASAVNSPRVCASAAALPFSDNAFCGALCMRLFQHLHLADERLQILSELRRVSDGPLILSYFDSRSFQHLRRVLRRRLGKPRSGRGAMLWSTLREELCQSGWNPLTRLSLRPLWSEQTLILAR